MNKEEFLYRMRYLNWHPLLKVRDGKYEIIIRVLVDEGGKLHPRNKPILYDVLIDGIVGPHAPSLIELNKIMRKEFRGIVLRLWRRAYELLNLLLVR